MSYSLVSYKFNEALSLLILLT